MKIDTHVEKATSCQYARLTGLSAGLVTTETTLGPLIVVRFARTPLVINVKFKRLLAANTNQQLTFSAWPTTATTMTILSHRNHYIFKPPIQVEVALFVPSLLLLLLPLLPVADCRLIG